MGLVALAAGISGVVVAQISDSPDDAVAGIPVNYTEAKVGPYTLPDPLTLSNGEKVRDKATWSARRRPEILRAIEENQFGRAPGRPAEMSFDRFDKGTPAFAGRALRTQTTIYFTKDKSDNYVDLLVYLPAKADGPVPLLLQAGWGPNNLAVDDPGVKVGRAWNAKTQTRTAGVEGRPVGGQLNVMQLIERGYGIAVFNYNDIDPDSLDSIAHGVRARYLPAGARQPADDEWGSISAWAWGISRMIDYFETEPRVDAKRIAISGVSRLGKTVLWAGARDERIALVIASVSGEGGAALSRRNYGETVAHLVAPTRYPYQFAPNYAKWAGRMAEAPFDAHLLISLVAPRPLLLQTGYTDKWSDPYGEFLAARAATPVYELLGKKGIEQATQPRLGIPMMNTLGYLMHDGGHGVLPADWPVFLDFMDRQLRPAAQLKPAAGGYIVEKDSTVATTEPGPHAGGGQTTAYSFFKNTPGLNLVFRKRALKPGSAIGYHEQTEDEIYYVLSGRGQMTLDGKTVDVGPGTAILTRTGSSHGLKQVGNEDLVILINYEQAPPRR